MSTTTNIGACGCCGPQCCCDGGIVTVAYEGCAVTAPAATGVTLEDISILVDWDGLTVALDNPYTPPNHIYYSGSASGGANFSCLTNQSQASGGEAFNASDRSILVNMELNGADTGCFYITGNIGLFISGTYASNGLGGGAQGNPSVPVASVCEKEVEAQVDPADPAWCANPYGNSVTIELIIAP